MFWKRQSINSLANFSISCFDLFILILLVMGGLYYLKNIWYWSIGYVGGAPYGDAQFWWNGAVHLAQGIFKDNPGKGYRPGFFLLTGLTLPVLGDQFSQFYSYFLIAFLLTAALFYLALRSIIGRWVAACVVGMLIFNPFTAEWLSTSTTDGMGLLLVLAALACLLLGVSNGLKNYWLIAFGLLFALANLTRPLMTPFIGMVILGLLLIPQVDFMKKLKTVVLVVLAFSFPLMLWMTAQKVLVNQWSLSSNDAGAFYAASDPAIQVWNSPMYGQIRQLAKDRYHVEPDDRLINRTFWSETLNNYLKYPQYHLRRIMPHLLEIARFTPKMSTHGTEFWRTTFFIFIAMGFAIWFLIEGLWLRAFIFLVLGLLLFYLPHIETLMTLSGAFLAIIKPDKKARIGLFLLSSYWFTGVVALYFVGGTWGPPLSSVFALNALGYRLGSQVFFVGDLLASYFLIWLAYLNLRNQSILASTLKSWANRWWQTLVCHPLPMVNYLVIGSFVLFLFGVSGVYLTGSSIVFHRAYTRLHEPRVAYPDLASIIKLDKKINDLTPSLAVSEQGGLNAIDLAKLKTNNQLIFTGAAGPFIWNMPGQNRTELLLYTQSQERPFTMGPGGVIVEIPKSIQAEDWSGAQGAFILQEVSDRHNITNLPYYLTYPAVRAFFPLSSDGRSFSLARAVWFPLVKNATQLETTGELTTSDSNLTWALDSGEDKFKRRFFMAPKDVKGRESKMELTLDLTRTNKPGILSFSYKGENKIIENNKNYYNMDVLVFSKGVKEPRKIFSSQEQIPLNGKEENLKEFKLPISNDMQMIKILFSNISPQLGIWFYEFNLSELDHNDLAKNTLSEGKNR